MIERDHIKECYTTDSQLSGNLWRVLHIQFGIPVADYGIKGK